MTTTKNTKSATIEGVLDAPRDQQDTLDRLAGRATRAIPQAKLAFDAMTAHPLARRTDADFGRLRQRPTRLDTPDKTTTLVQAELSVTVEIHPVSSLGLVALTPPSLPGARMTNLFGFYTSCCS
jgi:hypothetical protein